MVARSKDKMDDIAAKYPSELSKVVVADLSENEQSKSICPEIVSWCDNNLSLLVNNAGAGTQGLTTEKCEIEQFEWTLRLNLTSTFIMTKYLHSALRNGVSDKRHSDYSGCIVNIGSISGIQSYPSFTPYGIAKCGVHHLTKLNCLEFASSGIRVNCIAPSAVTTNWHKTAMNLSDEETEQYYANSGAVHPIGRAGNVQDIVEMVMFMANGSKSGWMTGQVVTLDGGRGCSTTMAMPSK